MEDHGVSVGVVGVDRLGEINGPGEKFVIAALTVRPLVADEHDLLDVRARLLLGDIVEDILFLGVLFVGLGWDEKDAGQPGGANQANDKFHGCSPHKGC